MIYILYIYIYMQLLPIELDSDFIVNIIFLPVVMRSTCESIPEEQSNINCPIFGLSEGKLLF